MSSMEDDNMFKSFYHGTTLTNAIGILNDMKRHNFLDWRKSESPWAVTCCNYDSLYLYDVFDRNVLWSAMMYAALTDYHISALEDDGNGLYGASDSYPFHLISRGRT